MQPFITQASPEGLYLLDIDIILSRIQTAAKFIKKFDINQVIIHSGRTYATTPIEKFCELTGAQKNVREIYAWNSYKSITSLLYRATAHSNF